MDDRYNVGLNGEWDQVIRSSLRPNRYSEEKDIRKAGLNPYEAAKYRGCSSLWIFKGTTEEDRKIRLDRQKKVDALPMKKTIHLDLEVEKVDCSGRYWLTVDSELRLARMFHEECVDAGYASQGFIDALSSYLNTNIYNKSVLKQQTSNVIQYLGYGPNHEWRSATINTWVRGARRSPFYKKWYEYITEGNLPSMSELFTRLMSSDEMKMIIRKAAQEAGKDLDESQLNLLASDQNLAKAYVKPILDAIQVQQQTTQPEQEIQFQPEQQQTAQTLNPLERLAEQMLNIDTIQQQIRKSMSVKVSDKAFENLLKDPQFRKTCIINIVTGILGGKTTQTVKFNEDKLDNLINPAPESQPESETEAQQQTTQPELEQEQEQDQVQPESQS